MVHLLERSEAVSNRNERFENRQLLLRDVSCCSVLEHFGTDLRDHHRSRAVVGI